MHSMNWNISGHEWAVNLLQQHISRGGLRHAYLFTGPPGTGRRTLALRFAQAINCLQPPAPGHPCGTCRMCIQLERMQQSDLAVVQSGQEGGELKVEAIRQLQHSLSLSPYEARYRIALLLRFQEANANAQNALLKTLEEAPDKAILLLTADSGEVLKETIVSRCEVLRLRPLPLETVRASLEARGTPPDQADLLAHVSGGRPGYAIRLSQSPDLLQKRLEWLDELWELLQSNRRKRFVFADKVTRTKRGTREERDQMREDLRAMILTWISFWRDVMLRSAGSAGSLTNPDQLERVDRMAVAIDLSGARQQVSGLEDGLERLNNANLTLLLEVLLLDLPRI